MTQALYVPISPVYRPRRCAHCARSVPALRVRYYYRDGGELQHGEVDLPEPHLAPCGAQCVGAGRGKDYQAGDALHSAAATCQRCALRRGRSGSGSGRAG